MRKPMSDKDNVMGQPKGKYSKNNDAIGTAYKLARESAGMEQREKDLTRQSLELMLSKIKTDQKFDEVLKMAAQVEATNMIIPAMIKQLMAAVSGGAGMGMQGLPPLPGGQPAGMPPPLPMGPEGMDGSMPSPMPMGDVSLPASPGMAMNDMGGVPPDAMMAPMY